MADLAIRQGTQPEATAWARLSTNRHWLGFWFMLPAAAFLILFLAYPLGLGVWLSFTDTRIGRSGIFVGLENYQWLLDDDVFWTSVFNTLLYTIVASVVKFAVGLYLALLLNENIPFKAFIRAIVLIPFIVPTVLSAIAFWWIYDPQFSIVSWSLNLHALITQNIEGLHQKAGSSPAIVVEVHGTIHDVECLGCGWREPMGPTLERVRAGEDDPTCLQCGGILKSATISFGQNLVPEVIERAQLESARAEVFLALGTSLGVYPAAALPEIAIRAGARLVVVNAQETPYDTVADAVVRDPLGEVLPALANRAIGNSRPAK